MDEGYGHREGAIGDEAMSGTLKEAGEGTGYNPRRRMLRWMALTGVAGGIAVLGLDALLRTPAPAPAAPAGTIRVKIVYFQMQQSVNAAQEYYELEGRPRVSDLMNVADHRHPALTEMSSHMLILIEGVPADGSTTLRDGDEVDLIPTMVGG